MDQKQELYPNSPLKPLTTENVLELWSRTYNTSGKPDWSHIFPYYHEDIVFQDTIQKVTGKTDFMAMCSRLTERCEELENGYFFDRRRQ